jgi:hypothetical protein
MQACFADILPLRYAFEPDLTRNLQRVEGHGEIFFDPVFRGKVFVCGFRVGLGREEIDEDLAYGYNFHDNALCDRDRRTIDSSLMRQRIFWIWRRGCDDLNTTRRMFELLSSPALSEEGYTMEQFNPFLEPGKSYKFLENLAKCFESHGSTDTEVKPVVKPHPVSEQDEREKFYARALNLRPVECNHRLLRLLRMVPQYQSLQGRIEEICQNSSLLAIVN